MEIRAARAEEIPALAQMMCEVDPWLHFGYSAETCRERLGDEAHARGAELRVVDEGGVPVAFALVEREGHFGGAWIDYICVAADHRGKGLGTQLLEHFIHVEFRGKNVYLTVSGHNTAAKRLYEKLGFRVVGTLEDYNFWGEPEYLMRLHRGPKREMYRVRPALQG